MLVKREVIDIRIVTSVVQYFQSKILILQILINIVVNNRVYTFVKMP